MEDVNSHKESRRKKKEWVEKESRGRYTGNECTRTKSQGEVKTGREGKGGRTRSNAQRSKSTTNISMEGRKKEHSKKRPP